MLEINKFDVLDKGSINDTLCQYSQRMITKLDISVNKNSSFDHHHRMKITLVLITLIKKNIVKWRMKVSLMNRNKWPWSQLLNRRIFFCANFSNRCQTNSNIESFTYFSIVWHVLYALNDHTNMDTIGQFQRNEKDVVGDLPIARKGHDQML